ncbi:AraC family transcriptional regulator [bacterium]|nr:MAG: AraC family transcriptional regulator [bacterium]
MTNPATNHLLRSQIFGAGRTLLYLSDPIMQGNSDPHDHDFLEIVLVGGGEATHISAHGAQPIARGDFFVLRPGAWHDYKNCRDLHLYNCCCAPELLRRELPLLAHDPAVTRLLWTEPLSAGMRGVTHRRLPESLTDDLEAQLRVLTQSPNEPFTVRAGRLLVLLGQLGNALYPHYSLGQGGVHVAVRDGIQLLEDAYDEQWDLARLASLTRLNPSYLTRLFKSATGQSPMAYLARHRVERAAKLLLATDQPISEIGTQVGWNDPNYFARRFKAVFGITPSAYRAQQTAPTLSNNRH